MSEDANEEAFKIFKKAIKHQPAEVSERCMSPPNEGLAFGYRSTVALICTGFIPTKGPWESLKKKTCKGDIMQCIKSYCCYSGS